MRTAFSRNLFAATAALIAIGALASARVSHAQQTPGTSYQQVENWAQRPASIAEWGEVAGTDVDAKGNVYAFLRDPAPRVAVFDAHGKYVTTWGEGAFTSPHNLRVLRDGFVWLADRRLQQVFKYDVSGKLVMTLGKKDVIGDNESKDAFHNVADVVLAPNGDIFVADGEGGNNRIVKFSKDGTFIKSWGSKGAGQGQFDIPHCIAMDGKGRIWVCDRNNKRIQLFDQDGKFLEEMTQFGAPVSIAFTKDDRVFVAVSPGNQVAIGTADGKIVEKIDGLNNPHGIAVDATGSTFYVAETMGKNLLKFVKK
jgi:DNA-binding beta-propeller fold protein YncE